MFRLNSILYAGLPASLKTDNGTMALELSSTYLTGTRFELYAS